MADHRRIRRLRDAVHDAARTADRSGLEWVGAAGPRREAVADHDDIREAICAA